MSGAPDKSLALRIVTSTDGAGFQQAETGLSGVSAAVGAVSATLSTAADQADRFTLSMTRAAQAGGGAGAAAPSLPAPVPVPGGSGTTTGPGDNLAWAQKYAREAPDYNPNRPPPIIGPVPAGLPLPPPPAPDQVPVVPEAPLFPTAPPTPAAPDMSTPAAPRNDGGGSPAGPAADGAQHAADATAKLNEKLNQTQTDAGKAKAALDAFKGATDAAGASATASGEAAANAGEASAAGAEGAAEGAADSAEGAEEQEEATLSLEEQVQKLLDALQKKKEKTKEASDAEDDATDKTHDAGQAALSAARFFDDLQYGIVGVTNNLPDMAEKFGLGAGVAGVLGILGVVLQQVITRFDLFGEEAKKLAIEHAKLSKSLRDAVISADAEKESIDAAEAALKEHEDAVEAVSDAYSDLTEEIGRTQAAREALNRAIAAETDEDLALKLLQIAQDKEYGRITEADAIRQSAAARRAAAATKFQAEDDAATKEVEGMSRTAKGLDSKAQERAEKNNFLRMKGRDLLDTEGLKQLDDRIKEAQHQASMLRTELSKLEEEKENFLASADNYESGRVNSPLAEAERREAQAVDKKMDALRTKLKGAYDKQRELMDKRDSHDDAAKETESNDADEFRKKLEAAEKEEKQLRDQAAAIRDQINEKSDLQIRNRRTYQTSVKVSEGTEQLDVIKVMNQEAEKAKREADRELQKKREKENEADAEQMRKLKEEGVDTTKAQQELADRRRKERRAEDERREQQEKDEKQKRLRPPDPMGPTQREPGPWEGPTKSGLYPQQAPGPMILGTPNERRHAMDNFGMTPADREAEARMADREAADRRAKWNAGQSDRAAVDAVRNAADALGKSAAENAGSSSDLLKEMAGILRRTQAQIDRQNSEIKTLKTQIRENRNGR